jgi:hypothetical protein
MRASSVKDDEPELWDFVESTADLVQRNRDRSLDVALLVLFAGSNVYDERPLVSNGLMH